MTPREILSRLYGKVWADSIIAALAAEGYQIMQSVSYPHTVNREYKIHSDGQMTVMA